MFSLEFLSIEEEKSGTHAEFSIADHTWKTQCDNPIQFLFSIFHVSNCVLSASSPAETSCRLGTSTSDSSAEMDGEFSRSLPLLSGTS